MSVDFPLRQGACGHFRVLHRVAQVRGLGLVVMTLLLGVPLTAQTTSASTQSSVPSVARPDSSKTTDDTSWVPSPAGSSSSETPKRDADNEAAQSNSTVVPPSTTPPPPVVVHSQADLAKLPKTSSTKVLNSNDPQAAQIFDSDRFDPTHPDYNKVSDFSSKSYGTSSSFSTKTYDLDKNDFFSTGDDKRVGRPTGLTGLDKTFSTSTFTPAKGHSADLFNKTYETSASTSEWNRPALVKGSDRDNATNDFQRSYFKDKDVPNIPIQKFSDKKYKGPEAGELNRELAEVQQRLAKEKNLPMDRPLTIDEVRNLLNKDQKVNGMDVAKEKTDNSSEDSSGGSSDGIVNSVVPAPDLPKK